jgi:alkanesulfonate monooxygenase SsuD/methylene tetrahydromethanopterin reductase-like flavin-dependent oxidoreductase (luciferase family)
MTETIAMSLNRSNEREQILTGQVAIMGQTAPEKARDRMIIGSKQECINKIEQFVKAGLTHCIFMQAWPLVVDDEVQAFAEVPLWSRGGTRC